jgi:eukaryotic-like serine/threonine-protein kinase
MTNQKLLHTFLFAILLSSCAQSTQLPMPDTGAATRITTSQTATPMPSIGSSQVSPKDGMVMVLVPAGEFKMGDYVESNRLPVHTVYLEAFWLDRTEVTNRMFAKFVEETGYVTEAEKIGGSYVYRATDQGDYTELVKGPAWNNPLWEYSDFADLREHPVVHVTWNDAEAYCSWAQRRLPTEAEWEKAASWNDPVGEKYTFPWGAVFDGSLLNFCDKNCSIVWADKTEDDGYAETAPVGSYPEGASPYGALDMAGNVFEYVADWYDESYYQNSPSANPLGPSSGENRVVRGGAWFTNNFYVPTTFRGTQEPSWPNYYTGFRCAKSP